jgi:hypothetical protein
MSADALTTAHATTRRQRMSMTRGRKTMNAFLDARSNLCYTGIKLSRIIISMAMAAALFTAPVGLASRSCILPSAVSQKACQSSCCANKTCCATSSKNTAPTSQPLAKADSSYKLNATSIAVPADVSPGREFGTQRFALFNAASGAHSPPMLALICIRLI